MKSATLCRASRSIGSVVLLATALTVTGCYAEHRASPNGDQITVYYTRPDGTTEGSRNAQLGAAHDSRSVAFFAATQAIAGPPSGVDAVRFPSGTYVRSVEVDGADIVVDLSKDVDRLAGGSFREAAAFKSLVWTMTALLSIESVAINVGGASVAVIPGGHFELDEPLRRSDF